MSTIHERGVPKVYAWLGDRQAGRVDLSRDVIAFEASKDLNSPMGSWSLTLLPRQSEAKQSSADIRRLTKLYRDLAINNVVSLGFEEDGGIMVGLINSISRTRTTLGDTAMQGLSITGSCFGKVLANDAIVNASLAVAELRTFLNKVQAVLGEDHPLLVALPGLWGPLEDLPPERKRDAVPTFIGKGVEDVIVWVLDNAASMRIPLMADVTGGDGKAGEYIGTAYSITTWNDGRVWSENVSAFQGGTVWSFIQSVLDMDFYEVCLQSYPTGAPMADLQLVVRPKPFDDPAQNWLPVSESTGNSWPELRTLIDGLEAHEIPEGEVYQEQIGISDSSVTSYYIVTAQHELVGNPDGLKDGLFYPAVDLYNANHYGIRQYNARLSLVSGDIASKAAGDLDYDGEVAVEIRNARNRLLNWNRLAPFYEAGSITVKGRDRYRPGDPVYLRHLWPKTGNQKGVRFYCTAVKWSWTIGQHYVCTLALSRGHNVGVINAVRELIEDESVAGNPTMTAET